MDSNRPTTTRIAHRVRRRRGAAIAAGALASALALAGCQATAEEDLPSSSPVELGADDEELYPASDPSKSPENANRRTDTFVSTISKPGGVFLPGFNDNGWDGNAQQPIFAGLVYADDAGNPQPDLAESWEVSEDNLTYTYHLREGLQFSDGSPLTADDVEFTLTLLNDPAYSGGTDFSNIVIAGTDAYKNGDADDISGIEVIDPATVRITTEKPNPLSLTTLGGAVISKAYYGADYEKGQLDYLKELYGAPLGAGPYTLDEYVEGQEIRYDANPNYYGGEPQVPHVIYKILSSDSTLQNFQNGDIDHGGFGADPEVLEQLKGLGFASIRVRTVPDIGQIWVNNESSKLAPTEARQALTYALDRQQIVDAKYKGLGQVADVYAAPTQWSYTNEGVTQYPFDPAKANELLDGLGWVRGEDGIREKDGERFTLSYITTKDTDPVIPIAEQNYAEVGIDFVPEVLDSNTAFARFGDGDYELAGFRTNGLSDPNDAVSEYGIDDPSINVSRYSNDRVTELVAAGVATSDREERQQIYTELYQVLSEDPPSILLDYRKSITAWNARVEGADTYITGNNDSAIALAKLRIAG